LQECSISGSRNGALLLTTPASNFGVGSGDGGGGYRWIGPEGTSTHHGTLVDGCWLDKERFSH